MTKLAALALLATLVLLPTAHAQTSTLVGDVGAGDNFVIALTDASGSRVTHLDPGTYTFVIHDRSSIHNFHLRGPGVDSATGVDEVGSSSWTVTLRDGTYTYVCDPHASAMRGTFAVGTGTQPVQRLDGVVGPGRTLSLRDATGARAGVLDAGPVVITVRDRTRADGFRFTGPGVSKSTGVRFRGTVVWRVTLAGGTYAYRPVKARSPRGAVSVGG